MPVCPDLWPLSPICICGDLQIPVRSSACLSGSAPLHVFLVGVSPTFGLLTPICICGDLQIPVRYSACLSGSAPLHVFPVGGSPTFGSVGTCLACWALSGCGGIVGLAAFVNFHRLKLSLMFLAFRGFSWMFIDLDCHCVLRFGLGLLG